MCLKSSLQAIAMDMSRRDFVISLHDVVVMKVKAQVNAFLAKIS